jgi:hypothetical protein
VQVDAPPEREAAAVVDVQVALRLALCVERHHEGERVGRLLLRAAARALPAAAAGRLGAGLECRDLGGEQVWLGLRQYTWARRRRVRGGGAPAAAGAAAKSCVRRRWAGGRRACGV